MVAGVSWGVTLGLAYAQRHADRVSAMVLGAVTAGTRRETDWMTRDMGRLFPAQWQEFVAAVPAAERGGDWPPPTPGSSPIRTCTCARTPRGAGVPGRTRTSR